MTCRYHLYQICKTLYIVITNNYTTLSCNISQITIGTGMTKTDLFDAATERYQELKEKINLSKNIQEKHLLQLEIINILGGIVYIFDKMKHLN